MKFLLQKQICHYEVHIWTFYRKTNIKKIMPIFLCKHSFSSYQFFSLAITYPSPRYKKTNLLNLNHISATMAQPLARTYLNWTKN